MKFCLPFCWSSRSVRIALLFFCAACLCFSCARPMNKGYRNFKRGKTDKAEKIFKKYLNDPNYDLAAEYYLLRMRTKKARKLRDWASADSAFAVLSRKYDGISPQKEAALKQVRARKRNVEGSRLRFQRRAIQLAERSTTTAMLDTIRALFPEWNPKLAPDWDSARAHVVNRLLPTQDYETATAILNRHRDVVYPHNFRHLWKLDDDIWMLFTKRYPLCDIHLFREDHPDHAYSKDCWFDAARAMFCEESIDSALAFLQQYPYSALEGVALWYVLDNAKSRSAASLAPEARQYLDDLHQLVELVRDAACELETGHLSKERLYHYLKTYAPRLSAFYLLQAAADYYLKNNRPGDALLLLLDMQPHFPDTFVCNARYTFQVNKQPWIKKAIKYLDTQAEDLHIQPANQWNLQGTHTYSAVTWDEGQEMYFAVKSGRKTRVMRSVLEDGAWSIPQVENTLSMRNGAIPMSMTDDGLEILLKIGSRLYISSRKSEDAGWNYPIRIPYTFPYMNRAVFAPDGTAILVDAAESKPTAEGKPKSNIYYCARTDDGRFHKPRPLSGGINTTGQEINPYLCADGKTLYFCSDGHAGYGGLDVFVSRRIKGSWTEWTKPENLGYGINTSSDDYGFTWVPENGTEALYTAINACSDLRDIWRSDVPLQHRPDLRKQLRGLIADQDGVPLGKGGLELQFNEAPVPFRIPISSKGRYRYLLPDSVRSVQLYANIPGYFTDRDTTHFLHASLPFAPIRDTFSVTKLAQLRFNLKLRYGTFRENTAEFNDPRVYKEMELLRKFVLRRRAVLNFIVHTDSLSQNAQALTEAQAETIMRYMLDSLGTPAKRISATGMGATDAHCPNTTAEGRACNRRVEIDFKILPPPPKPEPELVADIPTRTPPSDKPAEPDNPSLKSPRKKALTDELFEEKKPARRTFWQRLAFWKKPKKTTVPAKEDALEVEEVDD